MACILKMRCLFFFFSISTHVRPWELVRYSVCSHFRKHERAQSLGNRSSLPLPAPCHRRRNKAAIVNSPNFTAACRNPVLLFSFSSTSTLCRDQSGLSRPQKIRGSRFIVFQRRVWHSPTPCHSGACTVQFVSICQTAVSVTKGNAGTTQSLWKTLSSQP